MEKERLWRLREQLECSHNLIHCITNPISINDCANAVLAIGANPIMAQHPQECIQITSMSKALALNLGNFEDVRAEAMLLSGGYAYAHNIPITLDIVGVGCSDLRLNYAKLLLKEVHPTLIKGNLSELKALAGRSSHAQGIDVGEEDYEAEIKSAEWLQELAKTRDCCVLCSGKIDILTNGHQTYLLHNGNAMMTRCTGTGCMLNVLCAAFSSVGHMMNAALAATAILGIAAEKSLEDAKTPGQFHMRLFDWLYDIKEADFMEFVKIEEITI